MARVRKRSGNWQARWLDGDKLKSETRSGWTKQQALDHAELKEATAKRQPWGSKTDGKKLINDYGPNVLNARPISVKKLRDDAAAWGNRIEHHFSGMRVVDVEPNDVRHLVKDLSDKGYAASTVRDTYQLVRFVFATAQADGLIESTPCVRIALPRRLPEDEVQPAPPPSVAAIASSIDLRYRALVYFLAATGVRIGEALAVTRGDLIHSPRARVTIAHSMSDDGTLGPTKSRRSRIVTLPGWFVPILDAHLLTHDHYWVFPSAEGKALPPRRFSSRYWRPATRTAGFPKVTPHQLRHLHATELIAAGNPLTEVAWRLGHKNSRVTAEVYAKWIRPDDSGAADAVPDYSVKLRPVEER